MYGFLLSFSIFQGITSNIRDYSSGTGKFTNAYHTYNIIRIFNDKKSKHYFVFNPPSLLELG